MGLAGLILPELKYLNRYLSYQLMPRIKNKVFRYPCDLLKTVNAVNITLILIMGRFALPWYGFTIRRFLISHTIATWAQISLQDAASPIMEELIYFHDHTLVILALIITVVFYALTSLLNNTFTNRFLLESQEIETAWTVIPIVILIFLALPSLRLLYLMDEINDPDITIKATGHQWYWSYEYTDFEHDISFDSYMVPDKYLQSSHEPRLLETDTRVVIPTHSPIRVLVTSDDVLHAWAVPALGVKIDAVPGRLNQINFYVPRSGVFYGQCSEICGALHSFMPIVLESVPLLEFENWLLHTLED